MPEDWKAETVGCLPVGIYLQVVGFPLTRYGGDGGGGGVWPWLWLMVVSVVGRQVIIFRKACCECGSLGD